MTTINMAAAKKNEKGADLEKIFGTKNPEKKSNSKKSKTKAAPRKDFLDQAAEHLKKQEDAEKKYQKLVESNPFPENSTEWKLWKCLPGFNQKCLPEMIGWRILVKPRRPSDTFKNSSFIKPGSTQAAERYNTTIGHLICVGESYGKDHLSGQSWHFTGAEIGENVLYSRLSGRAVQFGDKHGVEEFLILNDDEILAIIPESSTETESYWHEYVQAAEGEWTNEKFCAETLEGEK